MDLRTRLIHSGLERTDGALVQHVFQSATYETVQGGSYDDIRYLRQTSTELSEDDELTIVPSIAGGCPAVSFG